MNSNPWYDIPSTGTALKAPKLADEVFSDWIRNAPKYALKMMVHKNEILGIAGVQGNGQTEFIEALTGLRKISLFIPAQDMRKWLKITAL